MFKRVTDFSDTKLWISWDNWRKLPVDTRKKIDAYGWDRRHKGAGYEFTISTDRLDELGLSKLVQVPAGSAQEGKK